MLSVQEFLRVVLPGFFQSFFSLPMTTSHAAQVTERPKISVVAPKINPCFILCRRITTIRRRQDKKVTAAVPVYAMKQETLVIAQYMKAMQWSFLPAPCK